MATEGHGPAAAAKAARAAATADRRSPTRNKISLRARTLNGEKLKVNDKGGNPIEIAAVVIWRVQDTAMALFDVDDYEKYVEAQSESALCTELHERTLPAGGASGGASARRVRSPYRSVSPSRSHVFPVGTW